MPKQFEIFVWIGLIVSAALFNIWVRTATIREAYAYVDREKDWKELKRSSQQERIRWLAATSPKELQRYASSLNLHPPRVNQMRSYSAEKRDH